MTVVLIIRRNFAESGLDCDQRTSHIYVVEIRISDVEFGICVCKSVFRIGVAIYRTAKYTYVQTNCCIKKISLMLKVFVLQI